MKSGVLVVMFGLDMDVTSFLWGVYCTGSSISWIWGEGKDGGGINYRNDLVNLHVEIYNNKWRCVFMGRVRKSNVPTYRELILPTYDALLALGGSGTNDEICVKVIKMLDLPDEIVDETHLGNVNQTELEYQLAWSRTYLKNYGVIINLSLIHI